MKVFFSSPSTERGDRCFPVHHLHHIGSFTEHLGCLAPSPQGMQNRNGGGKGRCGVWVGGRGGGVGVGVVAVRW